MFPFLVERFEVILLGTIASILAVFITATYQKKRKSSPIEPSTPYAGEGELQGYLNISKKAYVEILEILNHVCREELIKIPNEVIDFFKQHKDISYKFNFDTSKNIIEQDLMPETREIFADIYHKYVKADTPVDVTYAFYNCIVTIDHLKSGKRLRANTAQPYASIFAHPSESVPSEQFKVEITQDGWAAFRACNGKYISARFDKDNNPLFASANTIRSWECFKIYSYDKVFLIKTQKNEKYVTSDLVRSIRQGVTEIFACADIVQACESGSFGKFNISIVGKNDKSTL